MTEDVEFGLAYAFPDESASFVHGFEAGIVSTRMRSGEQTIDHSGLPLHTANMLLFQRMAVYFGYEIEISLQDETWTHMTFTKGAARPTLKVVT